MQNGGILVLLKINIQNVIINFQGECLIKQCIHVCQKNKPLKCSFPPVSRSSGEVANARFKTGEKSYFTGNLDAFYPFTTLSHKFKILYHIIHFKKKGNLL
jgi:hypothetical protein